MLLTRLLFKNENIHSGHSKSSLEKFGGTRGLYEKLGTSIKGGIADDNGSKQRRRDYFATNLLVEPPSKTLFEIFMDCFEDLTLKILIAAAIASLIIGIWSEGLAEGWYESAAILIAILIVVVITTANEHSQNEQFRALFRQSHDKTIKVIRDGKLREIDVQELLVGDVYEIETGLVVPTDTILIEKHCRHVTYSS